MKAKENKKSTIKSNTKEIIITIVVLFISIVVGFIAGKALFNALH